MKFGTTQTCRVRSGSNKKSPSRKLGSSFQKAHPTSAKIFRRRISAACASVGALESWFTVEPCATIKSAASDLYFTRIINHREHGAHGDRFSFFLRDLCGLCGYILPNEVPHL